MGLVQFSHANKFYLACLRPVCEKSTKLHFCVFLVEGCEKLHRMEATGIRNGKKLKSTGGIKYNSRQKKVR